MVQLKGEGSMTNRKLLVVTYPNNVTKDGKTQYLDVQLHAEDELAAGQSNLHAVTERRKDSKGVERINSTKPYSIEKQYNKILEAGQTVELPERNGKPGPSVTSIEASMFIRDGALLINTAKDIKAGPEIDETVLDKQYAAMKAAKEAKAAAKAAEAEAPEAEQTAEVENEATEPEKDDGPGLG